MGQPPLGKRIQSGIKDYLQPEGKTEQGIEQTVAFLPYRQLHIPVYTQYPKWLYKQI